MRCLALLLVVFAGCGGPPTVVHRPVATSASIKSLPVTKEECRAALRHVDLDAKDQVRRAELLLCMTRYEDAYAVLMAAGQTDVRARALLRRLWLESKQGARWLDWRTGHTMQSTGRDIVADAVALLAGDRRNLGRALRALRRWLSQHPGDVDVLLGIAALDLMREEPAAGHALALVNIAARSVKDDPWFESVRTLALQRERPDLARDGFERFVAQHPSGTMALLYTRFLLTVGQPERALEVVSRCPASEEHARLKRSAEAMLTFLRPENSK